MIAYVALWLTVPQSALHECAMVALRLYVVLQTNSTCEESQQEAPYQATRLANGRRRQFVEKMTRRVDRMTRR